MLKWNILSTCAGPNPWASHPVVRLALVPIEDVSSLYIDDVLEDAIAALLGDRQVLEDTELPRSEFEIAELLARLSILLQRSVGHQATEFHTARGPTGEVIVQFEIEVEEVGLYALNLILGLLHAVLAPKPGGFEEFTAKLPKLREQFIAYAAEFELDGFGRLLCREAAERSIPVRRIDGRTLVLGTGRFRQHVAGNALDRPSTIKPGYINRSLGRWFLPIPTSRFAADSKAALEVASRLDWPLAVSDRASGRKISPIWTRLEFRKALAEIDTTSGLIISPIAQGERYRFLTIGYKTVSVLYFPSAEAPLNGQFKAGEEVLQVAHGDFCALAEQVARALDLEFVSVDIQISDVMQSRRSQSAVIVGVHVDPDCNPHAAPTAGPAQNVAGKLCAMLLPSGSSARVPTAAVTGSSGKTTVCRMVSAILTQHGARVGLRTTLGVWVGDQMLFEGDCAGAPYGDVLLRNRQVDAAVLETARGGIMNTGLDFDRCDVAIVTCVNADHLGQDGIDTIEQLAAVKGLLLDVATEAAVLNADDPTCVTMASRVRAKHLYWFALSEPNAVIDAHIAAGRRAVRREGEGDQARIVLYEAGQPTPIMLVRDLPTAYGGLAVHNVANAMAALAAAHAIGVPIATIRESLAAFEPSFENNPGRLNLFDGHPFKVLVDMTKSSAAYRAVAQVVRHFDAPGQRIGVLSVAAYQRDEDIATVAGIVAGVFDHIVLFAHVDESEELAPALMQVSRYGRQPLEMADIFAQALKDLQYPPDRLQIVPLRMHAVDAGLDLAKPGDLVLIKCNSNPERFWKRVVDYKPKPSRIASD